MLQSKTEYRDTQPFDCFADEIDISVGETWKQKRMPIITKEQK